MTISGLSNYGGFQNYKVTDIPRVDIESVKQQNAEKAASEALVLAPEIKDEPGVLTRQSEDTRSKTADLDNISLTFNTGDDFSYLGTDFELANLDMEKAISDMHKDKILEDYQYFVGTANGLNDFASEDGKVIVKF